MGTALTGASHGESCPRRVLRASVQGPLLRRLGKLWAKVGRPSARRELRKTGSRGLLPTERSPAGVRVHHRMTGTRLRALQKSRVVSSMLSVSFLLSSRPARRGQSERKHLLTPSHRSKEKGGFL